LLFCFPCSRDTRALHSFPTRRSSDLRIGPYYVGPHGLLQPIADAIKLMIKEDVVPTAADRWVYNLAPIVFLVPCMLIFATLPFADRKSTRLNSSHRTISYAVFCLKKK